MGMDSNIENMHVYEILRIFLAISLKIMVE